MVPLAMEEDVRLGPLQEGRQGAEAVRVAANEVLPPAKRGGAASNLGRGEGDLGLAVACPSRIHLWDLPMMSLMCCKY